VPHRGPSTLAVRPSGAKKERKEAAEEKSSGQRLYVPQKKERKSREAYLEAKTGDLSNSSERAEGMMNEGL
jgi:hypothetical protein